MFAYFKMILFVFVFIHIHSLMRFLRCIFVCIFSATVAFFQCQWYFAFAINSSEFYRFFCLFVCWFIFFIWTISDKFNILNIVISQAWAMKLIWEAKFTRFTDVMPSIENVAVLSIYLLCFSLYWVRGILWCHIMWFIDCRSVRFDDAHL